MALEQKLSLKLAQKLVMTPSLQQAIKLLQMTRLELEGDAHPGAGGEPGPRGERGSRGGGERQRGGGGCSGDRRDPEPARASDGRHRSRGLSSATTPRAGTGMPDSPRSGRGPVRAPPLENTLTRRAGSLRSPALAAPHDDRRAPAAGGRRADHRQPQPRRLSHGLGGGDPSPGGAGRGGRCRTTTTRKPGSATKRFSPARRGAQTATTTSSPWPRPI